MLVPCLNLGVSGGELRYPNVDFYELPAVNLDI